MKKKKKKKNNKNCCSTAPSPTLKKFLTPGQRVSTLEQDGIYYKPYFDKEKGLYIPTIFAQKEYHLLSVDSFECFKRYS